MPLGFNFAFWVILHAFFCRLLIFFQNQLFQKISGIPSDCLLNSLDPDQDRCFVACKEFTHFLKRGA